MSEMITKALDPVFADCFICGESFDAENPQDRNCIPVKNGEPAKLDDPEIDGYKAICPSCMNGGKHQ